MFKNRRQAGKDLAAKLVDLKSDHPVIVALPRGGVPVGLEIARRLGAVLEIIIVGKIGAPGNAEFGIGAMAEDGVTWIDHETVAELGITQADLKALVAEEEAFVRQKAKTLREGRQAANVFGQTVILVDDGLATGVSAQAAIGWLRRHKAKKIVFAVPVGAPDTVNKLQGKVDELICLESPAHFSAVGLWYEDFSPVTDQEVCEILSEYTF